MLDNLHQLSWAIRIFYLMVLAACIANILMATRKKFKPHWRIQFGYTAVTTAIFTVYVALRLSGVLDRMDYARAIVWLYPLLAFPFLMVPCLFHWEDKFYKKALKAAIDKELIERDDR